MSKRKLPEDDPVRIVGRQEQAQRQVGNEARCTCCGETRPQALIAGSDPIICAECQRKQKGQRTSDKHHFAMEVNNPLLVPVPVNDHRAELNVAQFSWPKGTRENPNGSPLLAAAGCVRGFVDWVIYLLKQGILWVAEMLEALDKFLAEQLGPKWWTGTPLDRFAPGKA